MNWSCTNSIWGCSVRILSSTSALSLLMSSSGNVDASGYPPANEYMAERSTFLKISLTGDLMKEGTSSEKNFV